MKVQVISRFQDPLVTLLPTHSSLSSFFFNPSLSLPYSVKNHYWVEECDDEVDYDEDDDGIVVEKPFFRSPLIGFKEPEEEDDENEYSTLADLEKGFDQLDSFLGAFPEPVRLKKRIQVAKKPLHKKKIKKLKLQKSEQKKVPVQEELENEFPIDASSEVTSTVSELSHDFPSDNQSVSHATQTPQTSASHENNENTDNEQHDPTMNSNQTIVIDSLKPMRSLQHFMRSSLANTDMKETEESYLITIDLPGVDINHLEVNLMQQYLQIKATREDKPEGSFGMISRKILLPQDVNLENIDSRLKNGVLTIRIKKQIKETEDIRKLTISVL